MTKKSTTSGFTIVELMVTLAVAAILMGFALPAFNDFVRQRTMASRVNDLVLAVTYARSEAVRRGAVVSILALAPAADNEWGGGYCVVVDPDECDDAGSVLRFFPAMEGVTLDARDGLNGQNRLRFNSRGMLVNNVSGTIRLCSDDEDVDPGRVVALTATGRPDSEELECHG